jgi:hypothetical protein
MLRLPKKNGIAASLMDYARFNYTAQPGDKGVLLRQMGPYDHYAVNWGTGNSKPSPKQKFTL